MFMPVGQTPLPVHATSSDTPGIQLSRHGGITTRSQCSGGRAVGTRVFERISRVIDEVDTRGNRVEPATLGLDPIHRRGDFGAGALVDEALDAEPASGLPEEHG